MPNNIQTKKFLHCHRGVIIFCRQKPSTSKKSAELSVQIIDARNLQIVDNIAINHNRDIEIHTTSSLVDGKNFTMAEAWKAVTKHKDTYRWIILEKNKYSWGLFFAGGGLSLCRQQLMIEKNCSKLKSIRATKALSEFLSKLSEFIYRWRFCKQAVAHETSENINNLADLAPATKTTIANKNLEIPIHQSLHKHRVTVDLSENTIKQLDELGTALGMTREESLKYLLRSVLAE